MPKCRPLPCLLLGAVLPLACRAPTSPHPSVPTYGRDVAPIVDQHCAPCHRAGGVGPFALESYDQVRARARTIVAVTEQRLMPPWMPGPGAVAFVDERRLSDHQVATLRAWLEAGAPRGTATARRRPPPPALWQLGTPDHVATLQTAYLVPADGPDLVRNFRLPLPRQLAGRFVRAVELRPGNPRVLHHANLLADTRGIARALDAADPAPGWEGMVGALAPGGHFLGYTPGRTPRPFPPGTAWRLEPATELVLQLHLFPSGKRELIAPEVALFFTDQPPERRPVSVHLGSSNIDLPAGAPDVVVNDAWKLPVDTTALAIYPHAHYLARSLRTTATLPDGRELLLLDIARWDFRWQDEYRLAEPLLLPAGTWLRLEVHYDNSDHNPRNPNAPPRRVRWGPKTTDEMADVWIQTVPAAAGLATLRQAIAQRDLTSALEGFAARLAETPTDVELWARRAQVELSLGRAHDALTSLDTALGARPADAYLHYDRGLALAQLGRNREAAAALSRAAELQPDLAAAWANLGLARLLLDAAPGACSALDRAVELEPDNPRFLTQLALAQERRGDPEGALRNHQQALALDPELADAHCNVAPLYARRGVWDRAQRHLDEALRLRPDYPAARRNKATLLMLRGDQPGAIAELELLLEQDPGDFESLRALALAAAERGDLAGAQRRLLAAQALRPGDGRLLHHLADVSMLRGETRRALDHYRQARRLRPWDAALEVAFARCLVANGDRAEAIRVLDAVLERAPGQADAITLRRTL